jgi:hypothetical protein
MPPVEMLNALFDEAFNTFLARESANIRADISERNLCGRLMLYLDGARARYGLNNYFTDTEYNRNLGDLKRIRHNPVDPADIITCDLIVHSRGRLDPDNLIAIEMKKKKHAKKHKDEDRDRLKALTRTRAQARRISIMSDHVYGYQLGLFIELDTKRPAYLLEIYHRGEMVNEVREAY